MANEQELNTVISQLTKILKEEKKRLIAGRYEDLNSLIEMKQSLSERLDRLLVDKQIAKKASIYRKSLSSLVRLAKENEDLLEAAKTGASQAHSRIHDLLNKQRNVGVYGQTGDKLMMPNAGVSRCKIA